MAFTLSNSNYNGEALDNIYLVTSTGNEVVEKGAAKVHAGVAKKLSLPRMSQTADPIGDYTSGAPGSETATTTYAERSLSPEQMTVYETFVPSTFLPIWEEFQSQGDFTNLELNAKVVNAILELYGESIGKQMSKLYWQGDKTSGTAAIDKFNGIVTRAKADANVVKPTPQGNITSANFADILASVWEAIPDHFLDDPDFVLHLNTTDWKTMMSANLDLKKAYQGVFDQGLSELYQLKKIKHFNGMPRHHILGARVTDDAKSNLHLGTYVPVNEESFIIDKVAANSHTWFMRLDFMADANYSEPSDLLLYEPA